MCVALGVDLLGEPPTAWHPVAWYGRLIKHLEQAAPKHPLAQLGYGAGILLLAAPVAILPTVAVQRFARWLGARLIQRGNPAGGSVFYALIMGTSLKPFFALSMLARAGRSVRLCLERDDLPAARDALQSLVSRERSQLTKELAAAATIESLAENLNDAVVAPLLYYSLFGLPGAAVYRLCNTFDSMIGYHGQYEYLGKAAARLDDVLNLLPARLTALFIIVCAPLFGGQCGNAWRIWRRDARRTASPNAGHPMAAAAGALGVQLEKVQHYVLGDNEQPITPESIGQAEHMVWCVGCAAIILMLLLPRVRARG